MMPADPPGSMAPRAIVLFAHGSRDPLWRQPMEAVAARLTAAAPQSIVRCAYLELCAPDLPDTVTELVALRCHTISIVPMFLGVGKHAREDLPDLVAGLRERFVHVKFELQRPVGEDPRLLDVLATIAHNSEST